MLRVSDARGRRQEVEDPFLPEADPVVDEEDDEDIFLSQTEEETKREAAIEAAVIRYWTAPLLPAQRCWCSTPLVCAPLTSVVCCHA